MLIQNKLIGNKGIFYVGRDGSMLAELIYSLPAPGKMIIEHTEVSKELAGKKVGRQLVETAVNYARTNSLKIIPFCPYAKSLFKKVKEWSDVLE